VSWTSTGPRSDSVVDSQSDSEIDAEVASEYRNAATAAKSPFLPVYLRVSREENVRRIASSSRLASGTGKLVDASQLLAIRDSCDLFEFSDLEGLDLDVTELSAEESAQRLAQHIRLMWNQQS
jgi:hypothetical protein